MPEPSSAGTAVTAELDAIVIGAGPNGLAAAVTLARAGLSVRVYEAAETIGGGARTAELTLPGFQHDICSAVHPMAYASEFFTKFGLRDRIAFIDPQLSYAHPLDGGRAGLAYRDLDRTVEGLGVDGPAWRKLFAPLVRHHNALAGLLSGSMVQVPRHPIVLARYGLRALEQGTRLWNRRFRGEEAPAMLTGVLAHTVQPLPSLGAAAAGLMLATFAHAGGWPIPVGGSQAIVDCLADDLRSHGGEIVCGHRVDSLRDLPNARVVLFDTNARDMSRIGGDRIAHAGHRRLRRLRYGNGVAKVDFALSQPVPWANQAVRDSGVVHLGGRREDIARAEREVAAGRHATSPYVLVAQPSGFDPTRAPDGGQILWAYTHVPQGSTQDQTEAITKQIERFAPGFRDTILASAASTAQQLETYNANYVGGDIAAGSGDFAQLLARPSFSPDPWRTPGRGTYLCSSSAAPGPGVHGLSGWSAALSALRNDFGIATPPSLTQRS